MAASHRPSLITMVERTLREECRLGSGAVVLAAVSGGGDSMAMLHVLAGLSEPLGYQLYAHGVNHGLRPEAQSELDRAHAFAQSLGVHFAQTKIEIPPGGNLSARARALRYEALERAAAAVGASLIATAHHADDRAETVLMRLMRGAGPRGLAVLPPRAGALIRPLIRATRADIHAHLARHGIAFAEDPSNADPHYFRSRVRHQLLPLLSAESPTIVQILNALADQIGESAESSVLADLNLGRGQTQELLRMLTKPRSGVELALKGGWVLKLEKRSIRGA